MHINHAHFHFGGIIDAAALAALMRLDGETSVPAPTASPIATTPPRIGEPWPGIDGTYAGISRGENGEPDAHLVLLNAVPDGNLNWEAAVKWAESLGDSARLPTRFESALLYANLQDKLDTDRWHWTGAQYSSGSAWSQGFSYGGQSAFSKEFEARARAVRRLIL